MTIRQKREEYLALFRAWLSLSLGSVSLEYLARHDAMCLGSWCEEFVVQAFLEKWGRTKTAETLLAICDAVPVMKGMLEAAWAAVGIWEVLEPPDLHPPAPLKILPAMVVCAALAFGACFDPQSTCRSPAPTSAGLGTTTLDSISS